MSPLSSSPALHNERKLILNQMMSGTEVYCSTGLCHARWHRLAWARLAIIFVRKQRRSVVVCIDIKSSSANLHCTQKNFCWTTIARIDHVATFTYTHRGAWTAPRELYVFALKSEWRAFINGLIRIHNEYVCSMLVQCTHYSKSFHISIYPDPELLQWKNQQTFFAGLIVVIISS